MFGSAEWPRIRQALRTHFPEASAWTEWQHQADSVTTLSTQATFATNWGAEQGDVLGTVQSAVVLGQAREAHLGEFLSNLLEDKGVCDEWFVDDGQVFARPFQFDPFLRALDAALATFGATRVCAAHGNVKSSARLLCPPGRQHEFQGWDTPYVHDTVDVLAPEDGTTALGSAFGCREHINARAWESVRASDEVRSAIGSVDHAPTEMVLTRQCADVSKLMHHLRKNGDTLDQDLLVAFDGQLPASVSASLLVAGHHMRHLRRAGPPHGAGDRAPRLRRQSHYVPLLGIHHGRPHQPRLRRPESAHQGRVRLAHRRCSHAPRLDASAQRGSASRGTA